MSDGASVCCRPTSWPSGGAEATAEAITGAGLASANQVAAALTDLQAFAATPGTLIGDPRTFQVWAKRPRTP